MMAVRNQEPTAIRLERVLQSGRDIERRARWIVQGELADVRDHGELARAIHPIDSDDIVAANIGAHQGHEDVRCAPHERDVDGSTDPDDRWRQTTGECRDGARLRIDARNPAGCAFGDVQRTSRTDGAARAAFETAYQQHRTGRGQS